MYIKLILYFYILISTEHALKLEEYKKKMDKFYKKKISNFRRTKDKMIPYKKKLDEQNSRFATRDKANLAEEEVVVEKAEVAKVEEKEEEVSFSDGSDLSVTESEDEDQ